MGRWATTGERRTGGADDFAALRSVGLMPRPPVWGTVVLAVPPILDTIGLAAPFSSGGSRVKRLVEARQRLLESLSEHLDPERTVGVLGVTYALRTLPVTDSRQATSEVVELSVEATPLWSLGKARPTRPFRTAFGGCDVAALMQGGWAPVDLYTAGTTVIRSNQHRTGDAMAATSRANREIPGPTDMIQRGRRQLRDGLRSKAEAVGADGILIHDGFQVEWSSTYHLAQISVMATAVVRWRKTSVVARTTLSMA